MGQRSHVEQIECVNIGVSKPDIPILFVCDGAATLHIASASPKLVCGYHAGSSTSQSHSQVVSAFSPLHNYSQSGEGGWRGGKEGEGIGMRPLEDDRGK